MRFVFIDSKNVVMQVLEADVAGKSADELCAELTSSSGLEVIITDDPSAVPGATYEDGQFSLPSTAPMLDLDISSDKSSAAVGEQIHVTAKLLVHGTQQIAPLNQRFAVPIQDAEGAVSLVKGVEFIHGVADITLVLPKSGYFRITEDGINRKLQESERIGLNTAFEVTIYE